MYKKTSPHLIFPKNHNTTLSTICIIIPNLIGGGAERLHVNLAKHWQAQGYSVAFVLMEAKGDLIPLLPQAVSLRSLNVERHHQAILPLAAYFREHRPDVIIAAMWSLTSASVLAWLLSGRPGKLFLSDHTQLSVSCLKELRISPIFLKILIRLTYPFASGIIAVSEGVKADLCRLGNFDRQRIKVIYNPTAIGVSQSGYVNESRRGELWGKGFDYHLLTVGTLKAQKDHETLIKAFAKVGPLLNAKLTILGEGALRPRLEALIDELGLRARIEMPGFVIDPYPWYQTADLFVLSSEWEGFGNVLVEALECGLPIVSTDCQSGPAEILDFGKYGTLVPVRDVGALAEAIRTKLREPKESDTLKERAKFFSVEKIAAEYIAFFRSKNASV